MVAYLTALIQTRRTVARQDEAGASAVEYGLLIALIAGVIVTVVIAVGGKVLGMFTDAGSGW